MAEAGCMNDDGMIEWCCMYVCLCVCVCVCVLRRALYVKTCTRQASQQDVWLLALASLQVAWLLALLHP